MIVMKFGGTSVKDASAVRNLIDIVKSRNGKRFVVVSALGGVTDSLVSMIKDLKQHDLMNALKKFDLIQKRHIDMINDLGLGDNLVNFIAEKFGEFRQVLQALDILGEISPKSTDMILSQGEMFSSVIVHQALKKAGIKVAYADAKDIMITDSNYTEAGVDFHNTGKATEKICGKLFSENECVITGGFYGANDQGFVTTLGRGGSDYSAAIFASALKADKLEIWTDVDGILTSDPRLIKDTKLILNLSYTEAAELAFFGAKVLHPKTIYPAVNSQIPVTVLNTFNPENPGTNIIGLRSNIKMIKAIAFRKGITVINVNSFRMLGAYGFLSKVFEIFNDFETPIDLVATSEVNVSMTIDDDRHLNYIIEELEKFANVNIQKNQTIISAVGEGIRDTAGIAGKFFSALAGININLVSIGASDVNLSIVVNESDLDKAVVLLHDTFFRDVAHPEIFSNIN